MMLLELRGEPEFNREGPRMERNGMSMPSTWAHERRFENSSAGASEPMEEEKNYKFRFTGEAREGQGTWQRTRAPALSHISYRETKNRQRNWRDVMRRHAEAEDVPLRRASLPDIGPEMTRYSKSAEFDLERRRAQRYGIPSNYYGRRNTSSPSPQATVFPPLDRHGFAPSQPMGAPLQLRTPLHQQPAPPDTPAPKLPSTLSESDQGIGGHMPPPPPVVKAPRAGGATDLTDLFKDERHPIKGIGHGGSQNNMGGMSMSNAGSVGNVGSMGNMGMKGITNAGATELTKLFCGNNARNRTGSQTTMCEVCGKVLATLASKNRHLETHSNYRRYGCSTCGKRFRQNAHLKKHMRLHTGEKPFSCPHCNAI